MAKITLSDLANITGNETSAINTLNANWDLIEAAFDKCLYRDGTSPNQMTADLDMNSNDILNVGQITFSDGTDITQALINTPDTTTDHALVRWDGTIGAGLLNSGWVLADNDNLTAGSHLAMGGNNITNILNMTMTGSGDFDMNWATTTNHCEKTDSESSSSNAITLDLDNGNYFYTTLTENITTVTFTIGAASGTFTSWSWEITQDAGASGYTITWPAAVKWAGGSAPTLSTGASEVDIITFWTRDAGTTIYASVNGQAFS